MRRTKAILEKMLYYCDSAMRFTKGVQEAQFLDAEEKQFAVCMALMQLGELVRLLPEEYQMRHPEVQWQQIRGIRNFIAHEYIKLDMYLVWEMVNSDIKNLQSQLREQIFAFKEDDPC